ncbi:hypothetical protein ACFL1N_12915 [Thermodesulfobacteriota bacterium]
MIDLLEVIAGHESAVRSSIEHATFIKLKELRVKPCLGMMKRGHVL